MTRQYTQLVALMENWDFFQQNLKDAQNAEGSLQEQADIYAESWEGARKRVKASAQAIYSDLIDDKTFIKGTNAVADFLDGLDKVIDATGGLRTILLGLGAIGTKVFQTQIGVAIDNGIPKLKNYSQAFRQIKDIAAELDQKQGLSSTKTIFSENNLKNAIIKSSQKIQNRNEAILTTGQRARNISVDKIYEDMQEARIQAYSKFMNDDSAKIFLSEIENMDRVEEMNRQLVKSGNEINNNKKEELKTQLQLIDAMGKSVISEREKAAVLKEEAQEIQKQQEQKIVAGIDSYGGTKKTFSINKDELQDIEFDRIKNVAKKFNMELQDDKETKKATSYILTSNNSTKDLVSGAQNLTKNYTELASIQQVIVSNTTTQEQKIAAINKLLSSDIQLEDKSLLKIQNKAIEYTNINNSEAGALKKKKALEAEIFEILVEELGIEEKILATTGVNTKQLHESAQKINEAMRHEIIANQNNAKVKDEAKNWFANFKGAISDKSFGQNISKMTSGITQVSFAISSLTGIIQTFNNEASTGMDKLLSVAINIPMIISGLGGISNAYKGATAAATSFSAATGVALSTMGAILGVLAAVVAIGVAIYKYNNRFNDALKDATAATKEAKEAADSAQREYDSLLSTITDYKDAKTALGQLTKGTDEWKQKVMEINTQVLELMDNYSGLAQYVTSEDGVLSISDEGFNYLTETAYQRAQTTQGIYASKAIRQNKAEDNVTYQELAKELNVSFDDAKELTGLSNNAEKLEDKIQELGIKNDEVNTKIGEAAEKIQENSFATDALTQSLLDDANQGNKTYQEYKSRGFDSSLEVLSKENEAKKREQTSWDYDIDITDYKTTIKKASPLSDEWFKSLLGITSIAGLINSSKTEKDLANAYAKRVYGDEAVVTGYAGNKFKVTGGTAGNEGVQIDYQYARDYMIDKAGKEFTEEEMEKFGNDISKLRNKISDNVSGIDKSNENLDKLANDAFTLKHGGSVDFSNYSGETLESLVGTKTDNLKTENGTRKLVEAAQDYVNTQLYNPAKEVNVKDLQQAYTGSNLKNKFDLGISGLGISGVVVDASKKEDFIKEQYNAAWKKAVNEVAKSQGESETAVAQVLVEYQDKFGAFSKDNHTFDADKLTEFYKTQKKAKLTVEIENKAKALATETGLDSKDIKSYAQQLSNMKKYANYSADALTNLAKAQLRYEKAVANSKDNLSDWKKELKKAGKEALLSTETYQGLQNAYGDLFDIDGSLLSDSFIRSTKNADLLEEAIKGDTESYNKLKDQVANSIEVNFGLDKDSEFDKQITTLKDTISKDLGNFKAGVDIDVDQKDFYKQINNLANYLYSLGLSAEQVGDVIVSELGIDADVTEVTDEPEEKVVAYNMIPKASTGAVTSVFLPGGIAQNVSAPGIKWETEPVTATLETSTSASSVKVSNARKTSGGKIKKAMAGGKSLGKGKKPGGGSKKSPSTKTFKDDFNSSIERYHSIDRKIDKTTKAYEELSVAKDRAYGNKRLKIMDKETANIKKQISLEEKKLKQAQKYVKKDRKALKKAAKTAGTNIEFDKNGKIANYQKALKEAEKKVEKAYKTKDDDAIEKATKKYDKLVEAIKKYEDSIDTTGELQEDLNKDLLDLADIELEKITYKVDLKLDLNDRALKLIQRQLNQWERSNVSGYYDGSYLDQQINAMDNLKNAAEISNQAIHSILANTTIGTGDAARKLTEDEINAFLSGTASSDFLDKVNLNNDQITAIQKYTDTMLNAADSIRDIQDQIYEIFTKNFAQYQNDFDEQYNILTHQKNMISSLKEIFTLANTTNVELLDKMTEAIVSATKTQGLAYKENMLTAEKQIELIQGRLNENITDAERKALEANLKEWENYYRENNENMLSSVQEVLQSIQDELEKNIETIKKMYEKELSGGFGTFSTLELSYDMDDEIRDTYVPAYEKIYNLSKLTKDIQKSMDDTDSIKGKQKLLALQKRINEAMEDNVELTEYDLNRLEAEYQLELARIALEEAQNTKKNVRMQRDNLGNWSYVYTADEDKVAEAMNKYEESIYNLRKLDDERDKELERSIVDINTKYFERLQSIMSMDDGEAKDKAMTQLRDWYDAMLSATLKYAETVSTNERKLYESEANYYENTTGRKLAALGKWITTFSETSAMIKYGYTNMDQALDGYKSSVDRFTNQVVNEYTKSQSTANEIMKEFGINTEYANDVVDNLNNSLADTVNKIKELGEKLNQITAEDLAKMDKISKFDSTVDKTTESAGNIDNSLGQLTFDKVGQAATGAYTGNWQNTNGKLMFVHQNELILNKGETEAFFNLASILEKISLPKLFTPAIEQIQLVETNKEREKIEQTVTIKAEFPSVTEHNEIELAIDNLINRASQYTNRK